MVQAAAIGRRCGLPPPFVFRLTCYRGNGEKRCSVPLCLLERGHDLTRATRQLERMLDEYGTDELTMAVNTALERGTFATSSLAHLLDVERRKKNLKPLVPLALPNDPRVRELRITPHKWENYDDLSKNDND